MGGGHNHLFPKPDFSDTILQEGNINDTVQFMYDYIKEREDSRKSSLFFTWNFK